MWALLDGRTGDPERLRTQAALSGHTTMIFRSAQMADGERVLPTATTRGRLRRFGPAQPGDLMLRLSLPHLATVARDCGLALVINLGSAPFCHVAGPVLLTFADGGIPYAPEPEIGATFGPDAMGPEEPIKATALPAGLLDAALAAVREEPDIARASLVVRSLGAGRVFAFLVVLARPTNEAALNGRLADLRHLIGSENYCTVEYVGDDDPRLSDPQRAIALSPP